MGNEREKAGREPPAARSEAEVRRLRGGAALVDAGLQAARKAIRPNASTTDAIAAVCEAVRAAGGEVDPEVRVAHGLPLSLDHAKDRTSESSTLHPGELVSIRISGAYQGCLYAGGHTLSVGPPSEEAQTYLAHLAEAADWAIDSIEPGSRRRFVLTETRGRLLSVRGSGIGTELGEPPAIDPGVWVDFAPGMAIHLEIMLTCAAFGTGAISNMILLGPESAERLTRFADTES